MSWYSNPKVVCGCGTFGRPMRLLNETVKSFLLQDYQNKELIVYNDCDIIKLTGDIPGVTIINRDERHKSLGEKFNAMMELGDYDYWILWSDDDIFLPWAISSYIAKINGDEVYVPGARWYMLGNEMVKFTPRAFGTPWMCTKDLWERMGRYTTKTMGIDYDFCGKVRKVYPKTWTSKLSQEETFFIYRWGTGSYHCSSLPDPNHWDNIGIKVRANMIPGTYEIEPCWENDYVQMVKDFMGDQDAKNADNRDGVLQKSG